MLCMDDSFTECTPIVPPTADDSARTFVLSWWSESVWQLAKGIDADGAFDRMPILADALEEAGCDDGVILRHCRECRHHEPNCWVMTTILLPPSFPPNVEELLDLRSRIPLEVRGLDDTDDDVIDPGPGGILFLTSRPIRYAGAADAGIGPEPVQGYPRLQHPRPSPLALLLAMVIMFVVILVVFYGVRMAFFGDSDR